MRNPIIQALQFAYREGEISAAFVLGRLYDEGWGVRKNASIATKWYLLAAEGGNTDSLYFVGSAFLSGRGVRQDRRAGLRWLSKAASAGDRTAEYVVAVCMITGWGTTKNVARGFTLLRKVAARGSSDAMDFLAVHYCDLGRLTIAADWARRAIRAGHPLARQRLETIRSRMRPKR